MAAGFQVVESNANKVVKPSGGSGRNQIRRSLGRRRVTLVVRCARRSPPPKPPNAPRLPASVTSAEAPKPRPVALCGPARRPAHRNADVLSWSRRLNHIGERWGGTRNAGGRLFLLPSWGTCRGSYVGTSQREGTRRTAPAPPAPFVMRSAYSVTLTARR